MSSLIEKMESDVREIVSYWEAHGAIVKADARLHNLGGYSLRVNLGGDGLPRKWTSAKKRREYIERSRKQVPTLLRYINSEILPTHNRMGRDLDI